MNIPFEIILVFVSACSILGYQVGSSFMKKNNKCGCSKCGR